MSTKDELSDLVQAIKPLAESIQHLVRQAETQYACEVKQIINSKERDPKRIEQLLDRMLDFGFDDGVLALYKKLCRYYFDINPVATASYIYIYREMWEE